MTFALIYLFGCVLLDRVARQFETIRTINALPYYYYLSAIAPITSCWPKRFSSHLSYTSIDICVSLKQNNKKYLSFSPLSKKSLKKTKTAADLNWSTSNLSASSSSYPPIYLENSIIIVHCCPLFSYCDRVQVMMGLCFCFSSIFDSTPEQSIFLHIHSVSLSLLRLFNGQQKKN